MDYTMKTTAKITLTAIAFFAIGYAAGKAKRERKTTPVEKQEEPEGV